MFVDGKILMVLMKMTETLLSMALAIMIHSMGCMAQLSLSRNVKRVLEDAETRPDALSTRSASVRWISIFVGPEANPRSIAK